MNRRAVVAGLLVSVATGKVEAASNSLMQESALPLAPGAQRGSLQKADTHREFVEIVRGLSAAQLDGAIRLGSLLQDFARFQDMILAGEPEGFRKD